MGLAAVADLLVEGFLRVAVVEVEDLQEPLVMVAQTRTKAETLPAMEGMVATTVVALGQTGTLTDTTGMKTCRNLCLTESHMVLPALAAAELSASSGALAVAIRRTPQTSN